YPRLGILLLKTSSGGPATSATIAPAAMTKALSCPRGLSRLRPKEVLCVSDEKLEEGNDRIEAQHHEPPRGKEPGEVGIAARVDPEHRTKAGSANGAMPRSGVSRTFHTRIAVLASRMPAMTQEMIPVMPCPTRRPDSRAAAKAAYVEA